jgi:uncharacterized membrane protein
MTAGGTRGTDAVAPATPNREQGPPRLLGIDAARGIALLGMMATHVYPFRAADGDTTVAYVLADGRASALFAVLAGVSLALADGGTRGRASGYRTMLARVAVRAALIGLVGLTLAMVGTNILVILTYYAVLFLLAAPLSRLPAAVLAGLGLAWAVVGPVLSHAIRDAYDLPPFIESPSFEALAADPGRVLTGLLLTGTYPAFTWLAYALVGAAIGRAVLGTAGLVALAAGGLTLAATSYLVSGLLVERGAQALDAAGGVSASGRFFGTTPTTTWWWLAVDTPHSGTPFDLLATIGSSAVVIAVMLLVVRGPATRAFFWLTAAGSMTLSLYSLHILMVGAGVGGTADPARTWLIQVLIVLAVGMLWRAVLPRGPLETVVARSVDAVAPRDRPRRSAAA